jgi:hypothetical protein
MVGTLPNRHRKPLNRHGEHLPNRYREHPQIVILSEVVRTLANDAVEGPAVVFASAVVGSLSNKRPCHCCCSLSLIPRHVISTEAVHGLIVSSAVEKIRFSPSTISWPPLAPAFASTKHRRPGAPFIAHFAMGGVVRTQPAKTQLSLGLKLGFSPASKRAAKRPSTLPKARSAVRRTKRLILLPLSVLLFFFHHFLPKNCMSSPKTT